MGLSENSKGVILAVASSAFIGSSFILKKKGLKRAGASGTRAGTVQFQIFFKSLIDFIICYYNLKFRILFEFNSVYYSLMQWLLGQKQV